MSFLDIPRGPQRTVSTRRVAQNLALALVGAVLMLAGLRALGPIPTMVTLDAERVLAERETCDVLFVGPSYVITQIHTKAFDQAAKALSVRLHACVFGATGMRGVELRVHLQRLLAEGWPRLSLVVIDATLGDEPRFDAVNWFNPRLIQWHTWEAMPWIYDYYRRDGFHVGSDQVIGHLKHFGANYLNLGGGLHVAGLLGLWPRAQRLVGIDAPLPMAHERVKYNRERRDFLRGKKRAEPTYAERTSRSEHKRAIRRLVRSKERAIRRNKVREGEWLAQLRAMARTHGSEMFFIHAPVWRPAMPRIADVPGEPPLVLFDFNDPTKYPELYLPENRGRTHHVNWVGGVVYSKLLARELLTRWKPRR